VDKLLAGNSPTKLTVIHTDSSGIHTQVDKQKAEDGYSNTDQHTLGEWGPGTKEKEIGRKADFEYYSVIFVGESPESS
jgi:hypothetical protein